jgi:antibiotic biosynthesis monooxygenase (ABM) superfamily enzyme
VTIRSDTTVRVAGGRQPGPPRRHKVALLSWAGAWAVITLILWALGPVIGEWPLPLRTLVLSALMVGAMTWLVIPGLTRLFAGRLAQAPASLPTLEDE